MSDQDKNKNLIFINNLCSCIEFSGENCVDFLNNLLISDLSTFIENKFYYSALCNPKGRIIASLWVNKKNKNCIQLICPTNMQEELLLFFNMRKFRLKINIAVLETIISLNQDGTIMKEDTSKSVDDLKQDDFYAILFNLNLPWIDKSNTEKFIPQHVNFDQHENIMSFTKGCYPGQEIIARMKFLGKIKKRMCVIKSNNQEYLLEKLDSQNQISPIIKANKGFSVQIIEKIPEIED